MSTFGQPSLEVALPDLAEKRFHGSVKRGFNDSNMLHLDDGLVVGRALHLSAHDASALLSKFPTNSAYIAYYKCKTF